MANVDALEFEWLNIKGNFRNFEQDYARSEKPSGLNVINMQRACSVNHLNKFENASLRGVNGTQTPALT